MNKVIFNNSRQAVLFECELKGQISDGAWENSRPYDHWKAPCKAEVSYSDNPEKTGRNFYARKYNFANPELLEVVSVRMINLVKQHIAFPEIKFEDLQDIETMDYVHWVNEQVRYSENDQSGRDYWAQKLRNILKVFGSENPLELSNLLFVKLGVVNYTIKDLKKDLNDMKKVWSKVNTTI